MKEMNPIKNPLFNLYQNPYNPALMQTFRMMEKVPKLGQSMIGNSNNGNVFTSKLRKLGESLFQGKSKS
jgi:hypothetical protein